ncbi:glycosyltransferase family 4 protein [Massilia sp. 2TAF26]|uniref:glycosyltransferase family 4 protein n=1 Tax=Massilia sp. 2TAF26 TaxID=3233012 RepID=UPI003F978072
MSDSRRILHVITGLGNGGAEAVLYRLCLSDKQNSHIVISLMDLGYYGSKLLAANVDVHALDMPRGRVTMRGLAKLWNLIRTARPDVVQTWMYHADLLGGLAARLAGVKSVVWGIHHTVLEPGKSKSETIMIARLLARLSHFIPRQITACAEKSVVVHAALGYKAEKMVVVPNGYDLQNFMYDEQQRAALRTSWNVDKSVPLLGMVSRYDPQKDHANLIKALAELKKSGQRFCCLLVGSGMVAENAELSERIAHAGLQSEIMLLGPRHDIPAVMSALDLHVLSSSAEAFPNVLAEAMACGTPCVTTDVGDAALIVGDTGWVTPPNNAAALAKSMGLALAARQTGDWDDRKRRARQRVEQNFSLDRMVAGYQGVWNRAVV